MRRADSVQVARALLGGTLPEQHDLPGTPCGCAVQPTGFAARDWTSHTSSLPLLDAEDVVKGSSPVLVRGDVVCRTVCR